jgi:hypothetical protein
MAKTAPTVSNLGDAATVNNVHKGAGHRVTRVGHFSDNNESNRGNMVYEVFYCQTDHTLFVV